MFCTHDVSFIIYNEFAHMFSLFSFSLDNLTMFNVTRHQQSWQTHIWSEIRADKAIQWHKSVSKGTLMHLTSQKCRLQSNGKGEVHKPTSSASRHFPHSRKLCQLRESSPHWPICPWHDQKYQVRRNPHQQQWRPNACSINWTKIQQVYKKTKWLISTPI